MSKSERSIAGYTGERMIVIVELSIALSSHTGMSHNSNSTVRRIEVKLMHRLRTLIYNDLTFVYVTDTRSVSTSFLSSISKCLSEFS